jgi:hypothetical protein
MSTSGGSHTLDTLWGEERQPSERIALLKTIEQPYKITVSPHNAGPLSNSLHFIVVVLEQEHAFLLWQQRHRDRLASAGRNCNTPTKGALRLVPRLVGLAIARAPKASSKSRLVREAGGIAIETAPCIVRRTRIAICWRRTTPRAVWAAICSKVAGHAVRQIVLYSF